MITLILLLLLLLFFGVGSVVSEPVVTDAMPTPVIEDRAAVDSWMLVAGDGYLGVVVAEDAPEFVRDAGWNTAGAYWTPTSDDIVALEGELEAAWAANAPPLARDEDLSRHERQYVGAIEAGERLILVNAFCDPSEADWLSEPVVVADGGACYFRATWDVARAAFRALTVNGEA